MEPIKILYICTPQDGGLRAQLEKHLMILKRINQITLRLTRDILAGTNWSKEQDGRFQQADLILLLVSPDLIASDYHYGTEMRNALEKHDAGKVWVIPILLHSVAWEQAPFGKLQVLPQNRVPITMHPNQDDALADVVRRISEIVARLLGQKYGFTFSASASTGRSAKTPQSPVALCETCRVQNLPGIVVCRNCGDLLLTDAEVTLFSSASGPICPRCGLENRPGARFCSKDGTPLNQSTQAKPPSTYQSVWAIQARLEEIWNIQLVKRWDSSTSSTLLSSQRYLYNRGWEYMKQGAYAHAIDSFNGAVVPGQLSYEVVHSLGLAYREFAYSLKLTDPVQYRENLALATEQFEIAVALKTDVADFYFQLGLSYFDLEKYDEADSAFKEAQQIVPDEVAIYYYLGRIAMEQDRLQDALAFFLEGLKLTHYHEQIHIALGDLYLQMNQTQSAIDVLREVTQRNGRLWAGWYQLGRALMAAGEWKLAREALGQGRQLCLSPQLLPATTNFCSAMAQCDLQLNKKISARTMANEALQGDPNNTEALEVQGQL